MSETRYRLVQHSRLHSADNPIINYLEGIGFEIFTYISGEGTGLTLSGEFNETPITVDLDNWDERVELVRAGNDKEFYGAIETPERMEEVLNQITEK